MRRRWAATSDIAGSVGRGEVRPTPGRTSVLISVSAESRGLRQHLNVVNSTVGQGPRTAVLYYPRTYSTMFSGSLCVFPQVFFYTSPWRSASSICPTPTSQCFARRRLRQEIRVRYWHLNTSIPSFSAVFRIHDHRSGFFRLASR